jgi:uncharacterized membrane protein YoaK (UPF0700 family)
MLDYSNRQRALACLLAGVAGYVDAMGFRHLGGVFVSFMSGNTTRLGVDLATHDWMKAGEVAGIIVIFVVGAALGALIGQDGRRSRRAAILWTEAGLLATAASLPISTSPLSAPSPWRWRWASKTPCSSAMELPASA